MTDKPFIESVMQGVAIYVKEMLLPALCVLFVFAVVLRILIYYTVKRNDWFGKEFEKRIQRFIETDKTRGGVSFYVTIKSLLEKTYYELFEVRAIMKRRKLDYVMAPSDRLFLVQSGAAFLVKDTLKQTRFLRYGDEHPKFLEISKAVFQNNPCFNRVFGIFPAAPLNDMLNVLPGLFIIGGIFGTFLGIIKALPDLGGMNLNDVEGTKLVMDTFLSRISFSMSASAVGIFLSVTMTVINTFLSPDRVFIDIVNRYELALEFLWRRCDNNDLPEDIAQFDEHRDPIEALAEYAVNQEISRREGKMADQPRSAPAPRAATPAPMPPAQAQALAQAHAQAMAHEQAHGHAPAPAHPQQHPQHGGAPAAPMPRQTYRATSSGAPVTRTGASPLPQTPAFPESGGQGEPGDDDGGQRQAG